MDVVRVGRNLQEIVFSVTQPPPSLWWTGGRPPQLIVHSLPFISAALFREPLRRLQRRGQRDKDAFQLSLDAGTHEIRFLMARPWLSSDTLSMRSEDRRWMGKELGGWAQGSDRWTYRYALFSTCQGRYGSDFDAKDRTLCSLAAEVEAHAIMARFSVAKTAR